jgi:hypothetical protein
MAFADADINDGVGCAAGKRQGAAREGGDGPLSFLRADCDLYCIPFVNKYCKCRAVCKSLPATGGHRRPCRRETRIDAKPTETVSHRRRVLRRSATGDQNAQPATTEPLGKRQIPRTVTVSHRRPKMPSQPPLSHWASGKYRAQYCNSWILVDYSG